MKISLLKVVYVARVAHCTDATTVLSPSVSSVYCVIWDGPPSPKSNPDQNGNVISVSRKSLRKESLCKFFSF